MLVYKVIQRRYSCDHDSVYALGRRSVGCTWYVNASKLGRNWMSERVSDSCNVTGYHFTAQFISAKCFASVIILCPSGKHSIWSDRQRRFDSVDAKRLTYRDTSAGTYRSSWRAPRFIPENGRHTHWENGDDIRLIWKRLFWCVSQHWRW